MTQHPHLTSEIPGVSAVFKDDYEDFRVAEIPLYEPCGSGEHVYLKFEKRGLTTQRALREVARALNIKPRNIGYAGQKDARGVTIQTISILGVKPDDVQKLDIARLKVLEVSKHKNKLRVGHLLGNRFSIKLREVEKDRVADVDAVLSALATKGVPNFFGEQRFGSRGDTWEVGQALLRGDFHRAASVIAGDPRDIDPENLHQARGLFEDGQYDEAAKIWPRGFDECYRLCQNMKRFDGDREKAVMGLDKRALGFYVSAFQSFLFNKILADRIDSLGVIEKGDLAWLHRNGAVFSVEDAALEQPRADAFEISASGPMFGPKMTCAAGEPGAREHKLLVESGFDLDDLPSAGPLRLPGVRRPLRIPLTNWSTSWGGDERGDYLELSFVLPPGTYATVVIEEIGKGSQVAGTGL